MIPPVRMILKHGMQWLGQTKSETTMGSPFKTPLYLDLGVLLIHPI